jgi:hypothetical protein
LIRLEKFWKDAQDCIVDVTATLTTESAGASVTISCIGADRIAQKYVQAHAFDLWRVGLKKNVRVDAKATRKNEVWQKVVVRHTASQGKHTLTIRFTNDAYDGPGRDLNLYVRGAMQDGVAMKELSAGALYYPGQTATFETAGVA